MASMTREALDNIPLILVAAMAAWGLFSFLSVVIG
jgi:hypothetical protein